MPRRFNPRRPTISNTVVQQRANFQGKDYQSAQSGIRRHTWTANVPDKGSVVTGINNYFATTLARFQRSFSGVTPDVPPTATASNNYATASVMNGSAIRNFKASITLKNKKTEPVTLDIYQIALSFWDGLIWDTVKAANSPLSFYPTAPAEGEIIMKTPTTSIISVNDIASFKFQQHYLKKVGTITVGGADNANSTAVLNINSIPPKCRRSQTGMYYGLIFHLPSEKNLNLVAADFQYSITISFDEIPSTDRLPYVS